MTESQYEELKNDYIEHLIETVNDNGGLYPHVSVFADQLNPNEEDKDKPALIHIPIPNEYMENDKTKDDFINKMMPRIFKEIKKEFEPYAVLWSSEAWLRVVENKEQEEIEDYRQLPIKKEVIIITIGTKDSEEIKLYNVNRSGKQINKHGDMVDIVTLELMEDMSQPTSFDGKFTRLFKKFKD